MKIRSLTALALALGLASGAAYSADISPNMLAYTCAGCHGTDGASLGQAPVIDGFSRDYLVRTMQNYKNGKRAATIMDRIAKGYDDAQIEAMATFFASRPWANELSPTDPDLAAKGKTLHMSKGCIGCHGPTGISQMPNVPRLAGQYPVYLALTMADYADASKPISTEAASMRFMLKGLSEEDMLALGHFYASQKN
jgi:sulfide dehydrogenase cytochrome subunit